MLGELWRVELFGRLQARQGLHVVTRFRTQKTGVLLAYLAYFQKRTHPREQLIELLWPERDLDAGRASLRTALASLRRQLEPPGVPAGSVLVTDRTNVRLNPSAVITDVAEFDAILYAAAQTIDPAERVKALVQGVELYRGELLPGCYDDWIAPERERRAENFRVALGQLTATLEQVGDINQAIDYARRAVNADSLREEAHSELMRLCAAAGQPAAALRQYAELERILRDELSATPSESIRALAEQLRKSANTLVAVSKVGHRPAALPVPTSSKSGESFTLSSHARSSRPGSRLPLPLTRFFGRAEEIERLKAVLSTDTTRLVTLTGLGGSGKTRLAIEVAGQLREVFGEAIYFVALTDLKDARLIANEIAIALRLQRSANAEPFEQIVEALDQHRSLMILDNFEQLITDGALIVSALLECVSTLTCLVTSRHPLNITGEREFPVMPLPTPLALSTPEQLLQFESAQLFVDRAQAVRPDFQATQANTAAVAALCRRLEGIPLAVELAAAQAKVLTPSQMLEQLTRRFDFLISNRRDAVPRHATLRAAIDWSYQQLSPELRRFFMHLVVFRGGWQPSVAAAVCREPRTLDYLAQLQERSLIVAEEHRGEIRFRMLETLREYVGEQLSAEDQQEQIRLAERHTNFFLDLAERAEPHLMGPEQTAWVNNLEVEHDNLRAALDWCHTMENTAEMELRFVGALWRFWHVRGHLYEGRERLTAALQRTDGKVQTLARAKALVGAVALALNQGDRQAVQAFYEESLAISHELGGQRSIADVLISLGTNAYEQGDYVAARSHYEKSLAIYRESKERFGTALTLNNLGNVVCEQGDYLAGRLLYEESLDIRRELSDRRGIATVLNNLGIAAYEQGNHQSALTFYTESLKIRRELGDKSGIASSLCNLADVVCEQGDYPQATSLAQESLATQRELGNPRGISLVLDTLGKIAYHQGNHAQARSLYEQSLKLRCDLGNKGGMAWSLGKIGTLCEAQGQPERAARLFGAVDALSKAMGCPVPPNDQMHYDSSISALRGVLSDQAFATAWKQGSSMTLQQAVASALQPGPTTR